MNDLSVSVIIPAYRASATIATAVGSVLAQTRLPQEVLVVDDGSPEDLAEALQSFGDRVTLLRQPNGGAASARNLGLEKARGPLVAFLDADDYWEPHKLECQTALLQRYPQVGLVAGRFFEKFPEGTRAIATTPLSENALDRVLCEQGEPAFALATRIWTGTVLVRKAVIGTQRFISGLEPAEDRDLWARLVPATAVYMLSEPLATAVLHPGSLSRSNIDVDCRRMLTVVRRHRGLLGNKGLRRWEAHTYRRWAGNHLDQGRPSDALTHAWQRLRREPAALEAWWVLWKSMLGTVCSRRPRERAANVSTVLSSPSRTPVRPPTR